MDKVLALIDDMLATTLELRRCVEWRRRAQAVKPAALPFAILGLDDPVYLEHQDHEQWRRAELRHSLESIEAHARRAQNLEFVLQAYLPRAVWIRHEWRGRTFAVGMTKSGVFMCQLLRGEWQLSELIALPTDGKNRRIMPEWEATARRYIHGKRL